MAAVKGSPPHKTTAGGSGGSRETVPDRVWFSLMMIENPKSETFTLRFLSNRMFSG